MAGYISVSFRDSFVLFSFKELEVVKNADNALFYTSSPRDMCIYSTDIDNDVRRKVLETWNN